MTARLITALFLFPVPFMLKAQHTLTLQPDHECGKDAIIHGLSSEVNNNYGNNPQLPAVSWTFLGEEGNAHGAIEFDLSAVPAGSTISSAYLSLFAWGQNTGMGPHSSLSGPNDVIIQRITSPWTESTVTWSTYPSVTNANSVVLPSTNDPDKDFLNIDVTALVQDMINDPLNSHGFMLRQKVEQSYRRMNFCSSDHVDPAMHPRLAITFDLPVDPALVTNCMELSSLIIPNVFTPNSDGVNDDFIITSAGLTESSLVIYDRWGMKVFKSSDPLSGWDGRTMSGNEAVDGAYYYVFTGRKDKSGETIHKTGFLQLLR